MITSFNPYHFFIPELVDAFLKKGERFLVLQPCARARPALDASHLQYLLATPYGDPGHAKEHFACIMDQPHSQYFDLSAPADKSAFLAILDQKSSYRIFANLTLPGWEKRADRLLGKKFKALIEKASSWHPARWDEITTKYDSRFGEIYVQLRFRSQTMRLRLDHIEKNY